MNNLLRVLLLVIACLSSASALALNSDDQSGPATRLSSLDQRVDLRRSVLRYVDTAGDTSLDDIMALPATAWTDPGHERLSLGFDSRVNWFRFDLELEDAAAGDWLLELPYPPIDDGRLSVVREGVKQDGLVFGDRLPFNAREIKHVNFLLPLTLGSGSTALYLRVQTDGALDLPLTLWRKNRFFEHDLIVNGMQFMYYGLMIGMLIYNLFLLLQLRERAYLWYVFLTGSIVLFQASLHGYAFKFLWPEMIWWQSKSVAVVAALMAVFMVGFAREFLGYSAERSTSAKILNLLMVFTVCMVVGALLLPYAYTIRMTIALWTLIPLFILVFGFMRLPSGSASARYFLLAWTVFSVGSIVLSLTKAGFIPSNLLTENAQQIGSAIEVLMLSIALGQRYAEERLQRLEAQRKALESEREARAAQQEIVQTQRVAAEGLERSVADRTSELQAAMQQLSAANATLKDLSAIDGLTGVHNRRAFDEKLQTEWRRALRSDQPIALLLIDLDHFKQLNDNYGHLVGDECLRRVASTINDAIRRPPDFCARYGGEEFVAVLPETESKGAELMAERIRKCIDALEIRAGNDSIRVTASLGCCVMRPKPGDDMLQLIERADKALYAAKDAGRNTFRTAAVA